MKRILIVVPHFGSGGTMSSLESFLSVVDPLEISVDVYALYAKGNLASRLTNCTILPENIYLSAELYSMGVLKRMVSLLLRMMRFACRTINVNPYRVLSSLGGRQMKTDEYDAILSFQESLTPIVAYLPAKKRIAWIRCEYCRYCADKREIKSFARFDHVICVSNFTKQSLLSVIPEVEEKVRVIHNFLDIERIRQMAYGSGNSDNPYVDNASFKIISVGRFDPVKQFEIIPQIAKEIRNRTAIDFKWYIIGAHSKDNDVYKNLLANIKKYNVSDEIVILNETNEIYRYISYADILVQTSKSETFSRVVHEAKTLGAIPVINNYGCSEEFINSGVDGIISPLNGMGVVIAGLLENEKFRCAIKERLSLYKYDNQTILLEIINLF